MLGTFLVVVVGWVLFRSESLAAAARMLTSMAGVAGAGAPPATSLAWLLAGCAVVVFAVPDGAALVSATTASDRASAPWDGWRDLAAGVLYGVVLMTCIARLSVVSTEFLYYQF